MTDGGRTLADGTRRITVGVKTFLRTDKLRMCLESLAAHPWHAVIVADDGPIDAERERLYADFARRLPLELVAAIRHGAVRRAQRDRRPLPTCSPCVPTAGTIMWLDCRWVDMVPSSWR